MSIRSYFTISLPLAIARDKAECPLHNKLGSAACFNSKLTIIAAS